MSEANMEQASNKWNLIYDKKKVKRYMSLSLVQSWTAQKMSGLKGHDNIGKSLTWNIRNQKTPITKAISIGCGRGNIELQLLNTGLVENFDLFEISDSALSIIEKKCQEDGPG